MSKVMKAPGFFTRILPALRLALRVRRHEQESPDDRDNCASDPDQHTVLPARPCEDPPMALAAERLRRQAAGHESGEQRAPSPDLAERHDRSQAAPPDGAAAGPATTNLLASISHEVRTPMDAILGYAGLLGETPLDPRQRSYLSAIEQASETLLDIIDDVLSLSRIEAGKLTIHDQPFGLRETVDAVAQMLAPSAYRKGLDFIRVVAADVPPVVRGDPLRLRQVLVNLLTNAIKFTPAGNVQLLVESHPAGPQATTISFAVSDTGIGMSADERQALFQPFARFAHDKVDAQGTGLGLVITRRLCDAMGGSVTVTSAPGRGSLFTARIPVTVHHEQPAAPATLLSGVSIVLCCPDRTQRDYIAQCFETDGAVVRHYAALEELRADASALAATLAVITLTQRDLRDSDGMARLGRHLRGRCGVVALASTSSRSRLRDIERLCGGEALPAHTPMPVVCERIAAALDRPPGRNAAVPLATPRSSRLSRMRILLAEDNRFSRDYLHTLLASHGAQVDVCGNGDEALQALAAGAYDVVLMDLRMPVCSGLAALGKLRASGSTHPPVIGMTAAPEDCAAAREAGMEDCFVKPVRATALLERLCQLQGRTMTAASERVLVLDAEMRQELAIELPRHVQRLRRLLSERDRRALAEEAHRINGTAALCGFERLRSQAAALESSLRAGSTDGLDEGVQSLVAELEHVCSGL